MPNIRKHEDEVVDLTIMPTAPELVPYGSLEECVEHLKEAMREPTREVLRVAWITGFHVSVACKGSKYGAGAVVKMAKALGFADRTLYDYKKFHEETTWVELHTTYIPYEISFRTINNLLRIPADKRKEILDQVEGGSTEDIQLMVDAVREEMKPKEPPAGVDVPTDNGKPPKEDNATPAVKAGRSIKGLSNKCVAKVDSLWETLTELEEAVHNGMDEVIADNTMVESVEEALQGACNRISTARKAMGDFLVAVPKVVPSIKL
jgi:hypothetical protein